MNSSTRSSNAIEDKLKEPRTSLKTELPYYIQLSTVGELKLCKNLLKLRKLKNITQTELQLSTQQTNYSDAVNTCKSGLKTCCILESGHENSCY